MAQSHPNLGRLEPFYGWYIRVVCNLLKHLYINNEKKHRPNNIIADLFVFEGAANSNVNCTKSQRSVDFHSGCCKLLESV